MSKQQSATGHQSQKGGRVGVGRTAVARGLRSAVTVALSLVATAAAAGAPGSGMTAMLVLGAARPASTARPPVARSPRVSDTMSDRLEAKLERAFSIAVRQLDTLPECQELFARLGRDGREQLTTSLYYPAGPERERGTCRRALAMTHVGSPATRVCSRFDAVGDEEAAMVLLHEALHWSGLTERPMDPGAMSANDINELVRGACGL